MSILNKEPKSGGFMSSNPNLSWQQRSLDSAYDKLFRPDLDFSSMPCSLYKKILQEFNSEIGDGNLLKLKIGRNNSRKSGFGYFSTAKGEELVCIACTDLREMVPIRLGDEVIVMYDQFKPFYNDNDKSRTLGDVGFVEDIMYHPEKDEIICMIDFCREGMNPRDVSPSEIALNYTLLQEGRVAE